MMWIRASAKIALVVAGLLGAGFGLRAEVAPVEPSPCSEAHLPLVGVSLIACAVPAQVVVRR